MGVRFLVHCWKERDVMQGKARKDCVELDYIRDVSTNGWVCSLRWIQVDGWVQKQLQIRRQDVSVHL